VEKKRKPTNLLHIFLTLCSIIFSSGYIGNSSWNVSPDMKKLKKGYETG
jgi:hypothetical protein